MYSQRQFAEGLHVLRGLAALSVVFFHAARMSPESDPGRLWIVGEFGAGVTLFFLLSAFSLCHSNAPHVDEPGWLRSYAIKRFMRIAPLWWLFILITLVFQEIMFGENRSLGEIVVNMSTLYVFMPGAHESFVWAGWTIGVEVTFYFFLPVLLSVARGWRSWLLLFLITLVVSVWYGRSGPSLTEATSWAYMSFARQAFVFMLGAWLYFLARRLDSFNRVGPRRWFLGLSLLFFAVWAYHSLGLGNSARWGIDMLVVKALALGLLVAGLYTARSALDNAATRFFGDASFAIYLLHPMVIHTLKPAHAWLAGVVPTELAYLLFVALVLAVVLPVAGAIHFWFEGPMYRYGVEKARSPRIMPA